MARGKGQTRLSHEEVAERMVDYHFGRLSPAMNRAIEAHIRSCPRCKAEGLRGAASEREASGRKLRRVRGGKPLIGPRGRITLLALAVLIIAQTVLFQVTRGQAQPLITLLGQWHAQGVGPVLGLDGVAISPSGRFSGDTGDASAIALSLDGKSLAVSQSSPKPSVTLWNAHTGDRLAALPWAAKDGVAASFAWSPNGALLAAATSTTIVVWSVSSRTVAARFTLPGATGAQIYDVRQQAISSSPDPASLFAPGLMVWGADGALNPAPAGAAGPTGVTSPQTPVAGFWSRRWGASVWRWTGRSPRWCFPK